MPRVPMQSLENGREMANIWFSSLSGRYNETSTPDKASLITYFDYYSTIFTISLLSKTFLIVERTAKYCRLSKEIIVSLSFSDCSYKLSIHQMPASSSSPSLAPPGLGILQISSTYLQIYLTYGLRKTVTGRHSQGAMLSG